MFSNNFFRHTMVVSWYFCDALESHAETIVQKFENQLFFQSVMKLPWCHYGATICVCVCVVVLTNEVLMFTIVRLGNAINGNFDNCNALKSHFCLTRDFLSK